MIDQAASDRRAHGGSRSRRRIWRLGVSTVQISGALIAPGAVVVDLQREKGPASGPAAWSARCACVTATWSRPATSWCGSTIPYSQGEPRHRGQDAQRPGPYAYCGGAGWRPSSAAMASLPFRRAAHRTRRRSRRRSRTSTMLSESKLFDVQGDRARPGRAGPVARAYLAAERGNRRPDRAGAGQGQVKSRSDRERTRRRPPAFYEQHLVQLTRCLTTLERDAARLNGNERACNTFRRERRAGQGQDHRDRIADHPGRQGHGQRRLQRSARDQRQDRRVRRTQAHRGRPVEAGRYPRPAGRHGAAEQRSHRRRGDHRRRRHDDDRAAGRRPVGRSQGRSEGYRQAADRPEDPDAVFGLQPAHHAGVERRRHPGIGRRHHRPAHRAELLHHPRLAAAGGSGAARRQQQADPGHAGGSLCPDRRSHDDVLSRQTAA